MKIKHLKDARAHLFVIALFGYEFSFMVERI
jgi:hypothetical protein